MDNDNQYKFLPRIPTPKMIAAANKRLFSIACLDSWRVMWDAAEADPAKITPMKAVELQTLKNDVERLQRELADMTAKAYAAVALVPDNVLCGDLQKLKAEIALLRTDAERYRWLRQTSWIKNDCRCLFLGGDRADAAIDAARGERNDERKDV